MRLLLTSFLLGAILMTGCLVMEGQYTKLPPGQWRAILQLDANRAMADKVTFETKVRDQLTFEEVTEGELPVNFEVIYDNPEELHINFRNGDKITRIDDITYKHDRATNKDTVVAYFPNKSYLKVLFEDNILEGYWYPESELLPPINFVARHSRTHRFTQLQKEPATNLSGSWDVISGMETDSTSTSGLVFKQNENKLIATWVQEGDILDQIEGTIQNDKIYLSYFDGKEIFLLEARLTGDDTMGGLLRFGMGEITSFEARRTGPTDL